MDLCKIVIMLACGAVCLCEGRANLKMVNPNYVNITDYPFNVAVTSGLSLLGGGALVDQRWVLTSATVAQRFNKTIGTVRVASNSAYSGGRLHRVQQVFTHPLYASNHSYNLALMQLDSSVYPKVALAIPATANVPFDDDGITANLTGYGTGSSGKAVLMYLQYTSVTVHDTGYCKTPMQICSYLSYQGIPCYGDGGDPLFWCADQHTCILIGILNGDKKCATYSYYYFTDVGAVHSWIDDVIKSNKLD